jgi:16S rRNA (cytosine1402-N4)-methyltransferase
LFHHISVLKRESIEGLNIRPDGIYVDCTLGGAGHSLEIAARLSERGRLIAFDQDETALRYAETRLSEYADRVRLVRSNFRYLQDRLHELGIERIDGVLYDLGVSSPQLDEAERGFSYQHEAELDMRMDLSGSLMAYEIVNEWPEDALARILDEYGEEKFASRIARRIVQARKSAPIRSTHELAELIKESIPAAARRTGPHPAKRSFQAIRIAVNDELGALEASLEQAVRLLNPGGRLCVISFHSLEDRIAKQFFAKFVERCTCPPDFPVCVCRKKAILRVITRKPIVAGEEELKANARARSAKLRIAEKINDF